MPEVITVSQIASLKASVREGKGTNLARKLRKTGRLPGIVYGHTGAIRISSGGTSCRQG